MPNQPTITTDEALEAIRVNAEALTAARERADELTATRDALVAQARETGATYADISRSAGMSVSWVTGALLRSGGSQPRRGRPRRRA